MTILTNAQRAVIEKEFGVNVTGQVYTARKVVAALIKDQEAGLDNCGFINSKGRNWHPRRACLASLDAFITEFNKNHGKAKLMITYNTYRARREDPAKKHMETIFAYLTWLANDSQYAQLFVLKDAEDIYNYGALLRTEGFSPAYVSQASIHMRWISEQYQRVVNSWPLLVKQIPLPYPYNCNLAAYFLQAANNDGGNWTISNQDLGHSIFNHSTLTKKGLTNFMLGIEVGKGNMATDGRYAPLIQAWQPEGAKSERVNQQHSVPTKKRLGNRAVEVAFRAFGTPEPRDYQARYVNVAQADAPEYFKMFIKNNFTPAFIRKIGGLTI